MVFITTTQIGFAQSDQTFKADVINVIEKSGFKDQMDGIKEQILPNVPKNKAVALGFELDAIIAKFYDELAVYAMKEFTKEDVKAILAFYDCSAGKKLTKQTKVIAGNVELMMSLQNEIQAAVTKAMK